MQHSTKNLLAVTVAVLGLAVFAVPAQGKLNDLNILNVKLTLQSQGSFSDNGTITIYAKPATRTMNTKDLLNQLARDKYAQTNYPANFFPAGAKLAINYTNGACVVVDHNDALLVDVSDILSFSSGTNDIMSGHVSDATGLAHSDTTELTYTSLRFDDTFIRGGGNLSFFVGGVDVIETTDSTPGGSGNYHENTVDNVKNGAGEGQSNGTQFIVTGSIQGSRSVNLNIANLKPL